MVLFFFYTSRRRHTRYWRDWSSDVCSSDLPGRWRRMNQKDGKFCDASDQAGPALMEKRVSRGLAVADLFNDGNMDVVISDIDGAPMILKNHGVAGRHWVSFELAGTKSNRLASDARIKVIA